MISSTLLSPSGPFLHSSSQMHGVLSVLVSCLSCLEVKWQEKKRKENNRDSPTLFFFFFSTPGFVFLVPVFRAVCFLLGFSVVCSSVVTWLGLASGQGWEKETREKGKKYSPHLQEPFALVLWPRRCTCFSFCWLCLLYSMPIWPTLVSKPGNEGEKTSRYSPSSYLLFFTALPNLPAVI